MSSSQLLERVRTGQVKQDTLIRKDDSQWVPANQVSGLFEAANHTTTQRLCPYCGHLVDPPPTTCTGCNRQIVMSVNSRLTGAGTIPRQQTKPVSREEQAERLRKQSERQELFRYSLLLILWLLLLFVAPYLTHVASDGRVVFDSRLGMIWGAIATGLVGVAYFVISRFV